MASQVFNLRLGKGMSRGQSNEHLRNFSKRAYEEKLTHNFDPTREHLNFEILAGGVITPLDKKNAIDDRIKLSLAERGIKDPNEGLSEKDENRRNTVINIIFQGSRDRMRELAFGTQEIDESDVDHEADNSRVRRMPDIERWAMDMYHFACKKFEEKNIAAFVCHLDEMNPHIHCTVIPIGMIKGKERISATSVIGKNKHEARRIFKQWHDELAKVNARWGLERGKDIYTTGAKHRTTEEYWKWLSETCSDLEQKKYGLEREVKFLETERQKAERSVKGLTTMVGNLRDKIAGLESDIEVKQQDFFLADADTGRIQRDIDSKKRQLDELQAKLADKEQKLDTARQKLDELDQRCRDADDKVAETRKVLSSLLPDAQQKSINLAESLAWNAVLNELEWTHSEMSRVMSTLPYEERRGFEKCEDLIFNDNEMLNDLTNSGAEIVAVAANLFLGYVKGAMQYAQESGGGGVTPDSDWGRKKDEKDGVFMSRCLTMACQMMRPVRQIPVHRGIRR